MDLKELVELITNKVIEILDKKQYMLNNKKNILVLVSGSERNLMMSIPQIKMITDLGHDVKIVVGKELLNVFGSNRLKNIFQNAEIFEESSMSATMVEKSHVIVLPIIAIRTIGEIVSGMFESHMANAVIFGISNGKSIIASKDNIDWGLVGKWDENFNIINDNLLELFHDNIMKLQNAGICFTNTNSLACEVSHYIENNGQIKGEADSGNHFYQLPEISFEEKQTVFPRKLITGKDVDSVRKTAEYVLIGEKTIVTPLAQDKANEIGLQIRRIKS